MNEKPVLTDESRTERLKNEKDGSYRDYMNEYEREIESGKTFVRDVLSRLATEMLDPKVRLMDFTVTDRDFDRDQISLIDARGHVIAKIEENDLADCLADERVQARLEAQLSYAVRKFHGTQN